VAAVASRRDDRAFDALYHRHTPRLYRLALRLCGGSEVEAQDVVHDAWVRAVERLAWFEWRSAFPTWLAGIAIRCARERIRERNRHDALDDDTMPADEAPLRGAFDRIDLERAIGRLPPGYRQVLVLHDVEGYTHEEIGDLLYIDPGTSKSQLSRARGAMRRQLGARERDLP
jgi:RNA polymerase sigma-70 factor (ECF subfamily)